MTLTSSVDTEPLESFAATFGGAILTRRTSATSAARRVHNGLIDRRPAIIARCSGTADVAAAVRFARRPASRSRSAAAATTSPAGPYPRRADDRPRRDEGIHVDPEAARPAQGGVTVVGANAKTAVHGLAVTGGAVSTTGIAGYTLGGGLGWLMSTQGLGADNLSACSS